MNTREASERLGFSEEHIRRRLREGRGQEIGIVSAQKVGRTWYVELAPEKMGLRKGNKDTRALGVKVHLVARMAEPGDRLEGKEVLIPLRVTEG